MDTLFPDVSEYQPNVDFNKLRTVTAAVAARVSYGTRLDKTMPGRIGQVRRANFTAAVWYIFLRSSQDIAAQVGTVTAVLGDLRPGEAVCVDWEMDGGAIPSVDQRDLACELFEKRYQQPTLIYANTSTIKLAPSSRPVWVASYQTNEPQVPHVLWQYTDGLYTSGGYAPVDWPTIGKCDTSVFHGSAAQLAALISPVVLAAATTEQDEEVPKYVSEYRYPSGPLVRIDAQGHAYCYGLTYRGGIDRVPTDQRANWTDGNGVVRPIDPSNAEAGYIIEDEDDNFTGNFTPEWAAANLK